MTQMNLYKETRSFSTTEKEEWTHTYKYVLVPDHEQDSYLEYCAELYAYNGLYSHFHYSFVCAFDKSDLEKVKEALDTMEVSE